MAKDSDYRMYAGPYIPGYGIPLFVVAADVSDGTFVCSERYIFLPEKNRWIHHKTAYRGVPTGLLTVEGLLLDEIQLARADLERFFLRDSEEAFRMLRLTNAQIQEIHPSQKPLVHYKFRGMFVKQLEAMLGDTECRELRKHLGDVVRLPVIAITDEPKSPVNEEAVS